LSLASN